MSRSNRVARFCLALAVAAAVTAPAAAQVTRVHLAPVVGGYPSDLAPPTHRYDFCGGAVEWEARIENEGPAPATVTVTSDIRGGLNGANYSLRCPPTFLPPGVDPVLDVDCDPVGHLLTVRNIATQGCSRTLVRFVTDVANSLEYQCLRVNTSDGTTNLRSQTPLSNQVPSQGGDTCGFTNPSCNLTQSTNLRLFQTAVDENGPPLLPGDTVLWSSWIDFRSWGAPPNLQDFVASTTGLPPYLDFVTFVSRPLAPPANNASYTYTAATRMLNVSDPVPGGPPDVVMTGGVENPIVEWRAQIPCDAPSGTQLCLDGVFYHTSGGYFRADDPSTYTDDLDPTCVAPVLPDFRNSNKTVFDQNRSGDAQPGEVLTFILSITNSAQCAPSPMDCECDASEVEVIDTIDPTYLENITPQMGGIFTPPNTIRWTIPSVGSAGRLGATRQVFIDARVRTDARDGDLICNSASVTARELKSVADGGILQCATVPPTNFSLSPCIVVRVPAAATVVLDKAVTPALVPPATSYVVGSTITYEVTATNVGLADATNVDLWDCIDPAWATATVTPLDGGVVNQNPNPGCASGRWLRWPQIASLAASGGSALRRFQIDIPLAFPSPSVVANTAAGHSSASAANIASNRVDVAVCAPALEFTKSLSQTSYAEGDPITWTITVRNTANCAATNLAIDDVIDRALVEDQPILMWTDPPGATSTYDAPSGTIRWSLSTLDGAANAVFSVTSQVKSGAAPGPVCNTATLTWAQGTAPLNSDPVTGSCADITSGCAGPLPAIGPILGHRSPTPADVRFAWPATTSAADGYRVCVVRGDKTEIPNTCAAGAPGMVDPVAGCDPTMVEECVDGGAALASAGTLRFYQVKGLCAVLEGP